MKYICQTEAVALYLQKYIVYRKRKISFADGSFTSLVELIIKHKEEKLLLALSEPHTSGASRNARQTQVVGQPGHPGPHRRRRPGRREAGRLRPAGALFAVGHQDPRREIRHRQPAGHRRLRRKHAARSHCGRNHRAGQRPDAGSPLDGQGHRHLPAKSAERRRDRPPSNW